MLIQNLLYKDCIGRMDSLLRNLDKNYSLNNNYPKIISILIDLQNVIQERNITIYCDKMHTKENVPDINEYIIMIQDLLKDKNKSNILKNMKVYYEITELVIQIENLFFDINIYSYNTFAQKYYNTENMVGDTTLEAIGSKVTSKDNNNIKILQYINTNSDTENIFLKYFSGNKYLFNGNHPSLIANYNIIRKNVDAKCILGSTQDCKISNNCFDLTLNIPICHSKTDSLICTNTNEKFVTQNTFKYSRNGGYVISIMPFYRINKGIAKLIAKQCDDIKIYKALGYDFSHVGLVCIIARRKYQKTINTDIYNKLRMISFNINEIKNALYMEPLEIQAMNIEVSLFKGSYVNEEELNEIVGRVDMFNKILDKKINAKLEDKHPILPFSTGQIGLLLSSGAADGIVTKDNKTHLIKGRVIKKPIVKETKEKNTQGEDVLVTSTTHTNVVEIHAINGNGEYFVFA